MPQKSRVRREPPGERGARDTAGGFELTRWPISGSSSSLSCTQCLIAAAARGTLSGRLCSRLSLSSQVSLGEGKRPLVLAHHLARLSSRHIHQQARVRLGGGLSSRPDRVEVDWLGERGLALSCRLPQRGLHVNMIVEPLGQVCRLLYDPVETLLHLGQERVHALEVALGQGS